MPQVRTSIVSAVISLVTLIGFGTWAFRLFEDWTWAESFYFSVATLTTVGYGDIHPTSDGSRVFTAIFILIGVGIVLSALSRIGTAYLSQQENRLKNNISLHIQKNSEKNDRKS